jgi:hypothetical protein
LIPFKHYFLADGTQNSIKLSTIYDVSAKSAALACLSAAGDEAEFLYSAFADVKMLQFNSS